MLSVTKLYPKYCVHFVQKSNADNGNKWNTVGIFKDLTQIITGYIDFEEWNSSMLNGTLTSESIPDLSAFKRLPLEPGTPYRFRLSALNGCGQGEYGEVSDSQTKTKPKTSIIANEPIVMQFLLFDFPPFFAFNERIVFVIQNMSSWFSGCPIGD